jgi:hypothetical protein
LEEDRDETSAVTETTQLKDGADAPHRPHPKTPSDQTKNPQGGPVSGISGEADMAANTAVAWKRLSVNVANDVADAITTLQDKHGWTISDVIRRAISAYKFIDEETTEEGSKILIERKNGEVREVQFLH